MNDHLITKLKNYLLCKKINNTRPSSVVLKLTTKCNLSCRYCYVPCREKDRPDESMVENLFDQLMNNNMNNVECIFHGGEPLLRFDFIKTIINVLSKKSYSNQIRYSIQTNATLIDNEVVKFANNNKINIGISIDGGQKVHDLNRKYKNGDGSYNDVVGAINLMHQNNVNFSALSVVTEETLPYLKNTIDEFVRLGIRNIDIKPFFKLNYASGKLAEESFSKSMMDLLEHIINNSLYKKITIRDFKIFSAKILEKKENINFQDCISICDTLNCRAGINHITVDTNGDVYACDRLYLQDEFMMGNLLTQPLNQILSSKVPLLFESRRMFDDHKCIKCNVNKYCFKGCPATNYLGSNYEFNKFNYSPVLYCSYYKNLISKLLSLYETNKQILYILKGE